MTGKNDGGKRGCAIIAVFIVAVIVIAAVVGSLSGGAAGIGGFFADRIADVSVFAKVHPVALIIIAVAAVAVIIGTVRR